MDKLSKNIIYVIGLAIVMCFQVAFADRRETNKSPHADRQWRQKSSHDHRKPSYPRPNTRPPVYQQHEHYYQKGYRVNPLPHGFTRILVDAMEYYFFDGFFYRPGGNGYIVVDAPIGAIVFSLPRLHHIFQWHGQTYYYSGNTYYRRHSNGYVVVPNPRR